MLTKVEVKSNQFHKYKQPDDTIPPGIYYRSGAKPLAGLKALACTEIKTKRFTWLLPYEPWVKRAVEGWTPPEAKWIGKMDLSDDDTVDEVCEFFKIKRPLWTKLRNWHKSRLADCAYAVQQFGKYSHGEQAPIGAGKTLYGLILANAFERSVVCAPKHLQKGWADEATKWDLPLPKITTYHSAHHQLDNSPQVVVGDEALYAMNPTTGLHSNLKNLMAGRDVKIAVAYTGSSCSTKPSDLRWLRCTSPGCVPDLHQAWQHLWGNDTELVEVAPEKKVYVTKSWNLDSIAEFIRPYCGVVSLAEIAAELPPVEYRRVRVPCPKDWDLVRKGGGTEAGASKRVAQARQLSDGFILDDIGDAVELSRDKVNAVREIVENTEEAVVIYAAWSHTIDMLSKEFEDDKPAVLRGGSDYGAELARFLDGSTRILIANTRISTGMNLQERCRLMVFVSNDLCPVNRQQAEGRIVRPGQRNGCVIIDVLADGTMDERQLELLKDHRGLSAGMVESMLARELR